MADVNPAYTDAPNVANRGLISVELEAEGRKFEVLVDLDGMPVFFGGAEEMRRLMEQHERRKAGKAGIPAACRTVIDVEAPRFNWNPETERYERQ